MNEWGADMMQLNQPLSLMLGAAITALVLAAPAFAESSDARVSDSSSTIVVGSVQIQFDVKKSTLDDIPLNRLDDDDMGTAFLPGAFEPTAAGEATRVNTVNENRNDRSLARYENSDIRRQNDQRSALVQAVASIDRSDFSRIDGNVKGRSSLVSSTR